MRLLQSTNRSPVITQMILAGGDLTHITCGGCRVSHGSLVVALWLEQCSSPGLPCLFRRHKRAIISSVLSRHLDADEAVALGAALFAANLSTTFRLRKFGMADGVTYPVVFKVRDPPGFRWRLRVQMAPPCPLP